VWFKIIKSNQVGVLMKHPHTLSSFV
jgi:hypothetical protein